jgi:hypothetical protein
MRIFLLFPLGLVLHLIFVIFFLLFLRWRAVLEL